MEEHGGENADQGREGEGGVEHGVEAGGEEAGGILGAADGFDVESEEDFDEDGGGNNNDASDGIIGELRVKNLGDGFDEGEGADGENNYADHESGEVFVAAVAVGVFAVGAAAGEFCANNSDDRRKDIG